jgi:hypothetical protein
MWVVAMDQQYVILNEDGDVVEELDLSDVYEQDDEKALDAETSRQHLNNWSGFFSLTYNNLGDSVDILESTQSPSFKITLRTQSEQREWTSTKGKGSPPPVFNMNVDENLPDIFSDKTKTYSEKGSKRVTTCGRCNGKGKWNCKRCNGTGQVTCNRCNGHGQERCHDCGGTGVCQQCNGDGRYKDITGDIKKCNSCDGGGRCFRCTGSGKEKCGKCGGNGKIRCDNCTRGVVTCSSCSGSGQLVYYNKFKVDWQTHTGAFLLIPKDLMDKGNLVEKLGHSSPRPDDDDSDGNSLSSSQYSVTHSKKLNGLNDGSPMAEKFGTLWKETIDKTFDVNSSDNIDLLFHELQVNKLPVNSIVYVDGDEEDDGDARTAYSLGDGDQVIVEDPPWSRAKLIAVATVLVVLLVLGYFLI